MQDFFCKWPCVCFVDDVVHTDCLIHTARRHEEPYSSPAMKPVGRTQARPMRRQQESNVPFRPAHFENDQCKSILDGEFCTGSMDIFISRQQSICPLRKSKRFSMFSMIQGSYHKGFQLRFYWMSKVLVSKAATTVSFQKGICEKSCATLRRRPSSILTVLSACPKCTRQAASLEQNSAQRPWK